MTRTNLTTLTTVLRCGLLAGLGTLAACTGPMLAGKYDWNEGWREARVLQVGSLAEIPRRHRQSECLQKTPAEVRGSRPIAVLWLGGNDTMAAPVSDGYSVRAGEVVYLKPSACDGRLEKSAASASSR